MRNNQKVLILAALGAAVIGFGIVALILRAREAEQPLRGAGSAVAVATPTSQPAPGAAPASTAAPGTTTPATTTATPRASKDSNPLLDLLQGEEVTLTADQTQPRGVLERLLSVTLRLTLAAVLAAMLAFRPRRVRRIIRRNPFVAQTQILLAVVSSALMMIVGDSAARAFGIFAAVSFVRFRTNIRDPKEVTVLLVSLAIGLATGTGRWELAVILSFFILLLLWGLEYREPELLFRAMELTVKTKNVDVTQEVLLRLFRKYRFDAEMRTIDRPDAPDEVGCVVYHVNVSPLVSTDRLSEEILTADSANIDSVEWDQQKNPAHYYQ